MQRQIEWRNYQKRTNQKVVFNNYEEAEKHLDLTPLSKCQLYSLMHSFYDPSHTLIPQTMVFLDLLGGNSMIQGTWNGIKPYLYLLKSKPN